jgi:hypothetical protein
MITIISVSLLTLWFRSKYSSPDKWAFFLHKYIISVIINSIIIVIIISVSSLLFWFRSRCSSPDKLAFFLQNEVLSPYNTRRKIMAVLCFNLGSLRERTALANISQMQPFHDFIINIISMYYYRSKYLNFATFWVHFLHVFIIFWWYPAATRGGSAYDMFLRNWCVAKRDRLPSYAWLSSRVENLLLITFDIPEFYEKLSNYFSFHSDRTVLTTAFHKGYSTFLSFTSSSYEKCCINWFFAYMDKYVIELLKRTLRSSTFILLLINADNAEEYDKRWRHSQLSLIVIIHLAAPYIVTAC